jgi:hypothetical protein
VNACFSSVSVEAGSSAGLLAQVPPQPQSVRESRPFAAPQPQSGLSPADTERAVPQVLPIDGRRLKTRKGEVGVNGGSEENLSVLGQDSARLHLELTLFPRRIQGACFGDALTGAVTGGPPFQAICSIQRAPID